MSKLHCSRGLGKAEMLPLETWKEHILHHRPHQPPAQGMLSLSVEEDYGVSLPKTLDILQGLDFSLPWKMWPLLITHAYPLGWGRGGKEWLREQEEASSQEGPCGRRLAAGAMGHLLGGAAHTWPDPGTVATLIQTNQENPKKLG